MHCRYCGSINDEDDHRCLRCGRRMEGYAVTASTSYIGATALAVASDPEPEHRFRAERAVAPEQAALFEQPQTVRQPAQNVIPFEDIPRHGAARFGSASPTAANAENTPNARSAQPVPQAPSVPRSQPSQQPSPSIQDRLDLHPASSPSQGERTVPVGGAVQASGEVRVAPRTRRLCAGVVDVSMVLLGFGLFGVAGYFAGPWFGAARGTGLVEGRIGLITLAASILLLSGFYGLLCALARRETVGMNWVGLHLVTFDGHPLETGERAIRIVATWLSVCSGGLGLLWAIADGESLTFHDHISKTFPTEKRTGRNSARR